MGSPFSKTGSLRPGHSVFDLSHERKLDCQMGLLYPILVEQVYPGDVFNMGAEIAARCHQSLFFPLLHDVDICVHYFFVPYRILWHDGKIYFAHDDIAQPYESESRNWLLPGSWERYLTGNEDGSLITASPLIVGANIRSYMPPNAQAQWAGSESDVGGTPWRVEDGAPAPTSSNTNSRYQAYAIGCPGGLLDMLYDVPPIPDYNVDTGEFISWHRWTPFNTVSTPGLHAKAGSRTQDDRLSIFPLAAYFRIFNEYYRDENWQNNQSPVVYADSTVPSPIPPTPDPTPDPTVTFTGRDDRDIRAYGGLCYRNWEKDYFTSTLPWTQRGGTVALPITGVGNAVWSQDLVDFVQAYDPNTNSVSPGVGLAVPFNGLGVVNPRNKVGILLSPDSQDPVTSGWSDSTALPSWGVAQFSVSEPARPGIPYVTDASAGNQNYNRLYQLQSNVSASNLSQNTINLANLASVTINQLRAAVQLQKWYERNARCGVRYTEFIKSHFGASPHDDRLDRPEYIGGTKQRISFAEVLQTSESTDNSAQGSLAGHGISAGRGFIAKYRVYEHGLIMGLLSIMPRSQYHQGVNRQWNHQTRLEYYWPEFAHLGEMAVHEREVYLQDSKGSTSDTPNAEVFGFQGRYDEYRQRRSTVHGNLHFLNPTPGLPVNQSPMANWHLARHFTTAPVMSQKFVSTKDIRRDIFPISDVQASPPYLISVGNVVRAVRPMPLIAEPAWLDHF